MQLLTDRQAMFDASARGIASHFPLRSASPGSTCKYRGPEGTKCGVGHLILDDTVARCADKAFDPSISALITAGIFPDWVPHEDFLTDLQSAHDAAAIWSKSNEVNSSKFHEDPWHVSEYPMERLGIAVALDKLASKYLLDAFVLNEVFPKKELA